MLVWSPLPRTVGATFRDVESPKASVRLSAITDLVRWAASGERERCIAQLKALLESDPDVEVRAAAAVGLADAGANVVLPELVSAAQKGPPRVAQMALVAIGELAPRGAATALGLIRETLASEAPALRFQALVAAQRLLPAPELRECLLPALSDPEARVRYVACRIAEESVFTEGAPPAPEELVSALQERLSDAAAEVALAAALILARRGSDRARAIVVRALNRCRAFQQPEDEQAAIELCADLGLSSACPGLRARAFGGVFGSSPLAFQARVALARLGDARAREQILRDLSSFRRSVRARAVAAAGQARLEAARQRLMEMRSAGTPADLPSVVEALEALEG
jgi:HEAT repeat protein